MPAALPEALAHDTRAALLQTARDVFAERGYAATHLEDIAQPLGLTKGAIYHHFGSKAGLFAAVYAWLEEELLADVDAAVERADGAWERTVAALDAYLEASADAGYVRIVHAEARHVPETPAVDREVGHALVRGLLEALIHEGVIRPLPLDTAARVIRAAVDEVVTLMAEAPDRARARAEGRAVVLALLEGLRA